MSFLLYRSPNYYISFSVCRVLSEYRRCIVRVQLPSRHVAQLVLLSGQTVSALKEVLAAVFLDLKEKQGREHAPK